MGKRALAGIFTVVFLFCFTGFGLAAETIKVGAPLCLTGAYAADGLGYLRGIETAVNEINSAGGLLGKQLEIVKFDTQELAPERVMQAADKLIGKEKVDTVHGGWAGWGQDVRAYGKYNVPFFMWDASINSISVFRENPERYSNVFQLIDVERSIARYQFETFAKLPLDFPNKKIAMINADDSWGMETAAGVMEMGKELGWETVVHETVPYGTREWGPILTKIRKAKPAFIHVEIVYSPDLITFFRQFMKDPTPSLVYFGYGMCMPDFLPNLGAEGNGLLGGTSLLPGPVAPNPRAKEWADTFNKTYNDAPSAGTFPVYTGVMIWAEAVKAVGDVKNYKAINQYVANNKFTDLNGATFGFDNDHKILNSDRPGAILQIQDGKSITIFNGMDKYLDYEFQTPSWMK
jgi:ABC-type branched-subunit amino acid transport system substrate-binding protein